jgi:hypothetical protein
MTNKRGFLDQDELLHPYDPDDVLWNESWFFSWMPHDDGPAGFYRLGVLPNQKRGWLWFFIQNGDEWICFEETRLAFEDFDFNQGASYDKWALRFGYRPIAPLNSGNFHIEGIARVQGGKRSGHLIPVAVNAQLRSTTPCFATGPTGFSGSSQDFEKYRFEQSVIVEGTLEIDGVMLNLRCSGHRDRSWGTRNWRMPFVNVDLHFGDDQIYWASAEQPRENAVVGYVRRGSSTEEIVRITGAYNYAEGQTNLEPSDLTIYTSGGSAIELQLIAKSNSILWNMAHTGEPWDNWPYWRTRLEGKIAGEDQELCGWFDASRYRIGHVP